MDEQPTKTKTLTTSKLFLKATLLSLLIAIGLLLFTAVIASGFAYYRFTQFLKSAELTSDQFMTTVKTGLSQPLTASNDHKNILLLGVDSLETRGGSLPLTDTMMLISLDAKTGQVNMMSLPRDLWHEEYRTRINALYAYGLDRFPTQPQRFSEETIETMTGVPIHHTVVLSMDQVAHIIDLLGGVEIDVKQGFTDTEFPRTDVDVTVERDPQKLYETITFEPGKQTMDGERALKYMRSRHSEHEETGTDVARSQRQQQLIAALVGKMRQRQVISNPKLMGQLYRYYLDTFAQSISPEEGIATLKALYPLRGSIELKQHPISIYPDDPNGIIEHPPQSKYAGQWVYAVRNAEQFKQTVQQTLGISK
jgi:LCP family protein required for cell wall assembly